MALAFSLLPFAAAVLCALLAVASVLRKTPSLATWSFCAGMLVLAMDAACTGMSLRATNVQDMLGWLSWGLVCKSLLPLPWLAFSLTYSRGHDGRLPPHWLILLAVFTLVPVGLALGFRDQLMQLVLVGPDGDQLLLLQSTPATRALSAVLLVAYVLVLMHLEQTFRAGVGTMRWRMKYVVLGLGTIFGARIYVRSQAILFSTYDLALAGVEASGLLIGCLFLALAYARTGFAEIDVYPSRAVLRSSLTVLIVGSYLFLVGVLAQVARRVGGVDSFQFQALIVLVGVAGLAVLLLSDRLRQGLQAFVGRHFARSQYDSVKVWTALSHALGTARDRDGVCEGASRLVASTFEVLSVSVWIVDDSGDRLARASATVPRSAEYIRLPNAVRTAAAPLDIESVDDEWAAEWREANPSTFPNGGHRWVVPLRESQTTLGAIVLADRVNGAPYSHEALDLLQCIADQVASTLQNLRLGHELAEARELETFRTMSAFFVHDLKNAAASLNLMLKNLPVHFDDPEFRADALRGIGNTASRIDTMIARLGALRENPTLSRRTLDINAVVGEAIERAGPLPVAVSKELLATSAIDGDREQLVSVISNLILNARDAVADTGSSVQVRTRQLDGGVSVTVQDDGCGMTQAFIRDSLFKPFRSTKSKGLGVGMYQARLMVEAHGGQIQVESEEGVGTIVCLLLPAQDA